MEGRSASVPRIGSLARRDVATASLTEPVRDAAARRDRSGYDTVVVVEDGVVLGVLGDDEVNAATPDQTVAEAMRPGPSTYRPDVPVAELMETLVRKRLASTLVTTPEGRLVGLLLREDAAV